MSSSSQRGMKLPLPDPVWGHYLLSDGSIIYRSGGTGRAVRPGMFFLLRRVGEKKVIDSTTNKPRMVPDYDVVTDGPGLMYFHSPLEAMRVLVHGKT